MSQLSAFVRAQVPVIRVISLDVERSLAKEYDRANFAEWCAREFCGAEPEAGFLFARRPEGSSHRRRGFAAHHSHVRGAPPPQRSSQ